MTRPKLDTRIHLVEELEKLPQTPQIIKIIAEAKAGEFHDYKNKKYACGKMAASTLLRAIGQIDLAKRVENGDFDETADEEDVANMREFCPPELHETLGLLPSQNN